MIEVVEYLLKREAQIDIRDKVSDEL